MYRAGERSEQDGKIDTPTHPHLCKMKYNLNENAEGARSWKEEKGAAIRGRNLRWF